MMPPKKSKAARGQSDESEPAVGQVSSSAPKKKRLDVDEKEIVEGKRKRIAVSVYREKMLNWLDEHLEEREETRVSQGNIYSEYVNSCVDGGYMAEEQHIFYRELKSKFPKGFGIKAESPFHDIIKEKKVRIKKKVVKVQAETLRLKMKDIIENAIREHGNPKKGVRFHNLKTTIAAKYPALRIDLRPSVLKNALAKGVRFGHFIAVRGIGACGLYRVPLAEGEEEEEEKPDSKGKEKKDGEGEEDKDEGEKPVDTENSEGENENKENKEAAEKPADEGKEEEEDTGPRKTRSASKPKPKAKKSSAKGKKKSKESRPVKRYRSFIVHSDPQRVEDTFQMALTFMSEPKITSFLKMKKYFSDYYPDVSVERLKKGLAAGEEKGFWLQVSGQGASGSYELTLEEIDPSTDDNINSMIANSIIACNEPKQASAQSIKQYILDYHTDFKVNEKPHLFKKALERAINKNQIRQLTGIGASGSFQLVKPFVPTPTQLQGEDDEDYYNQSSDEEDNGHDAAVDDSEDEERINEMLQEYRDKYVPRPTKRRGHGRENAAGIAPFTKSLAPLVSSRRRRR